LLLCVANILNIKTI